MQGDNDPLVPMVHSEMLDMALTKAGVKSRLMVIKGAGHGFKAPDSYKPVAEFFDETIGRP
jgi:dipeptidyl aminopeptidase/acylaminoacyl peptidase